MLNKTTSKIVSSLLGALQVYRNISIKKKLLLVLYIQILIPLIFIGYFSFKSSEEIITNKSLSYSKDILSVIELRLQDSVRNLTVVSQDLSNDLRVYSALIIDENNNINRLNSYVVSNQLYAAFSNVGMTRSEIKAMCLVTNKQNYSVYPNWMNSNIKTVVSQNYEEIRQLAAKTNGSTWFFDSKNGVVNNAYLVRRILNRDTYQEIGLLVIQIDMNSLDIVLQGLESEVMQNTTILSPENDIILCKNKAAMDKYQDIIKTTPYEKNSYVNKENEIFVAYTTLSQAEWRIVTYIPLQQLYQDVNSLRLRIIIFCIGSILILSVVSIFMSFDMIKPINQLVRAMKDMNINNIQKSYIEINRKDELGFLHKTFNNMAKEIDNLVTWIYREQITRKEAEIKALQSQINPHFLFNTLESINWMAQLNNVPEISDTVSDLSTLMEASIGRDDRLITIEEEFMYIDKYIALLKRRFEDKISLNKEVDPKVLYVKIPRLLIQPLIENAVYHGVESSRGKGIITLSANIKDDLLIIEVIDNGNGISNEELVRLNKFLEMDNDTYFKSLSNKQNKSIGIDNVNRRIKLFYGEKYGIKIESKINIYTKVSVTLPAQNYNKEGYYVQSSNN